MFNTCDDLICIWYSGLRAFSPQRFLRILMDAKKNIPTVMQEINKTYLAVNLSRLRGFAECGKNQTRFNHILRINSLAHNPTSNISLINTHNQNISEVSALWSHPSSFLLFLLSLGELRGDVFHSLAGSLWEARVPQLPEDEARLATSSSWSLSIRAERARVIMVEIIETVCKVSGAAIWFQFSSKIWQKCCFFKSKPSFEAHWKLSTKPKHIAEN